MSKDKVRKWKEEYSKFGFIATKVDGVKRLQCILCHVVFCSSNLKTLKLSGHFINKQGKLKLDIMLKLQKQNELVTTEVGRFQKWALLASKSFISSLRTK